MKILTIASVVTLLVSCNAAGDSAAENTEVKKDSTTTAAAADSGWIALFDGSTTKGWHRYGGESFGNSWRVADGSLHYDPFEKDKMKTVYGGRDIDLVTDEEFENFHLKIEWKTDTACNSGIVFLIHEDTAKYKMMWETGLEMQVVDNERHPDSKINKHRAGDLYDLIASSRETVKPAGEWNQAEIRLQNGKLDFFLNGVNNVSTNLWDDNWKKLVADSKWKDYPDFASFKKGRIGLQDHGKKVWYRNIQIQRL